MPPGRAYHHGSLRQAVLAAAVDALSEVGPADISLRDLARRAGVSHAAPAYHFGDKAGLFTALAEEGFGLLADALAEVQTRSGDFVEVGVAYVQFAVEHRAHFEVMFRPELYHADSVGLLTAQRRAADVLYGGVATVSGATSDADTVIRGTAAWSLVHGFATLWLNKALPTADDQQQVEAAARAVARVLFAAHDLPPQ